MPAPADPFSSLAPVEEDRSPPAIAERLRDLIRVGVLGPGAHLSAGELAERFGVSRGPVREALRLLESAGLVRILPQKGAFVVALGDEEVRELLSIREVLFAALAQRCAERSTPGDREMLSSAVKDLADMAARPSCGAREFQRATDGVVSRMYRIAAAPRLARMIQDLSSGPAAIYGHLAVATRDMRLADLRGYERLMAAISAGDGSRAFAAGRMMHAEGVERAFELDSVMPKAAPSSQALKGRRQRRYVTSGSER